MLTIHPQVQSNHVVISKSEFDEMVEKLRQIEQVKIDSNDSDTDLMIAAESSLDFWDNDIDDKVWNDA